MIVIGEGVCEWVAAQAGGQYYGGGVGFGIEKEGRIVCGVFFEDFNGKSMRVHVGLEKGQRMTAEWLRAWSDYAFRQLQVNKLIGVIDSKNAACLNFTRHLGFVDEGCILDAGPVGDLCILTMTREQCRFLRN